MYYSYNDIKNSLQSAGLRKGDNVFVTTSLGMLGIAKNVSTADELNSVFFNAIIDCIGSKGTILVPTYSYTFGKLRSSQPPYFEFENNQTNELERKISDNNNNILPVFDVQNTESKIGPFPNFFLKQPGIKRSIDPMVSVTGFGDLTDSLFNNLPYTSYGNDCVFDRLKYLPTKCCSIGLGPNWMPFIHHADWINQCPFRFDKYFKGLIKNHKENKIVNWQYYARILRDEADGDGRKIGYMALKNNIFSYSKLGRAGIYLADYKMYFDLTMKLIKKDPWLTARGPKFINV